MQEQTTDLNGIPLFYRSGGQGPAIVLLHGFAEDGCVWEGQYELFPGHRLIVPDLPGSGRSARTADMSMDGLADTVHGLLEALDALPCILIGHSMGGYVALAFAEHYSHSLRGFGLFQSTAFADTEEKKSARRKGISFMKEHGAFAFLQTATPNLYSPETKAARPELVSRQLEAVRDFSAKTLCAYYESMQSRPDRTAVLRSLPVPVLLLLGRADTAVPLADGLKQSHLPALSLVEILDQSGHMGMQEEKEKADAALKAFINWVDG